MLATKNPVYVFHHIPKCGGTSLKMVLNKWFITIKDYRIGWTGMNYPEKVDIGSLRSCHCLCGHFEFDGYYLHQRYPEVLMSDRYRVITFVRDPLQIKLSLFRYEKMHNQSVAETIEDRLFMFPNYLSKRFPATLDNYRDVIDRYYFVGILEENEMSLNVLASMMGKPFEPLPWVNKSYDNFSGNENTEYVSQEVIARFKEENSLDYQVYAYCLEKFKRLCFCESERSI